MEKMDKAWALKQASKYAKKYAESKDVNIRQTKEIKALEESLEQVRKELEQLARLTKTQQKYIEKLENRVVQTQTDLKETTILTINHLQVVKDDAC